MITPTRRCLWLAVLGIPIAALCASAGSPWLGLGYNVVLLLATWVSWRLGSDGQDLRLSRRFDAVLSVRMENRIDVELHNDSGQTIIGRLRDEPPALFSKSDTEFDLRLHPGETQSFSYKVRPPERGSTFFRGTFLRLQCPLGLAERIVRLKTEQPVRVYPNVLALREMDLLNQRGRLKDLGMRQSRMRGLGTEFESLRDYAQGDDYRKIDWKASARRTKMVVRQFEQERNQSVILCIDIGRHMLAEVDGVRKLDHVLDAVFLLAHSAQRAGDCVGLLVYAENVRRYLPPRKGRDQVGFVIEALHDLVAEPLESDPAQAFAYLATRMHRRGLIVHFTECADMDRAKTLVLAHGSTARRHLALIARVSDPHVKEILSHEVATNDEMFRKAAAILATDERKLAKSHLLAAGLHDLEAEPQELADALVRFYWRAKDRALL
ncbi:MAG: DUF58 domain-containing protein [Fimbriimonas sp.]